MEKPRKTEESRIGKAWASFRVWVQNADKYDWGVVGAMAPAIAILIIGIFGALYAAPVNTITPQFIEDEHETVVETAVEESPTVVENRS